MFFKININFYFLSPDNSPYEVMTSPADYPCVLYRDGFRRTGVWRHNCALLYNVKTFERFKLITMNSWVHSSYWWWWLIQTETSSLKLTFLLQLLRYWTSRGSQWSLRARLLRRQAAIFPLTGEGLPPTMTSLLSTPCCLLLLTSSVLWLSAVVLLTCSRKLNDLSEVRWTCWVW